MKAKVKKVTLLALLATTFLTAGAGVEATMQNAPVMGFAEQSVAVSVDAEATLSDSLKAGGKVVLNADITVGTQLVIPEGVTTILDLNGHKILGAFNGTSTTNHIYVLRNYGTLTIEDSVGCGAIVSRGVYNHGTLTLNGGTIDCCDGNGGYALNNETGSTFVMNGGVITASYEDDHMSSGGGYDATALEVPTGCTATLNGGKITSVTDFTFAIAAGGTLNIPADSTIVIEGYHGAISVSGGVTTINGGTFKVPNDGEGRTDNLLYVYGGSLVINGGTFIGDKDLPNGGACIYDTAGSVVVNGGNFSGSSGGDVWGTTGTTINGGTFENLIETAHVEEGAMIVNGGKTYIKMDGEMTEVSGVAIGSTFYETLQEAIAAAQEDETLTLSNNITLSEMVVIPQDKKITIDLNGFAIAMEESIITTTYAFNNLGNLTLKDGKGTGSVSARGIYNGYENQATAVLTVESGTYNACGTNGGGAAIFNYGTANVKGGTFTSVSSYSLNNRVGATMIIDGGKALGGMYNDGATLTINDGSITNSRSGSHTIYAWNTTVTINDGDFYNNNSGNATIMAAGTSNCVINGGTFGIKDGRVEGNASTWTSFLTDVQNTSTLTVNGGTFDGGSRVHATATMKINGGSFNNSTGSGYAVYGEGAVVVKGGAFTDSDAKAFAGKYLVDGVEMGEDGVVTLSGFVQIGETTYATLQEAIDMAQDGDMITLLADIEQADGVLITNKNVVIDFNGKTFTVTEGTSTNSRNIKVNGSSVVTLMNGTMVAAGDYSSGCYGTVRTEGTANVTMTGLKLYNYRGNGLNIKACSGTNVVIMDTEIYSQYGGGVESAGGVIELTNVKVEQKGMYTAPYNSMAISVNGGGKVTVNSGVYATECITKEEANGQGTSHGPWVAGVLNSGGTLVINGGTFSNDNFGDNALATAARGAILADTGAVVEINGGTFNALKKVMDIQNNLGIAAKNPTGTIKGGVFSADPTNGYVKVANGYQVVANADGTYAVEKLPIVTGVNLTIGSDLTVNYYVNLEEYLGKEVVMQFVFNGETTEVNGEAYNGNTYKFSFEHVTPQKMGDTIIANVVVDGEVVETKEYSVKEYCETALTMSAEQLGQSEAKYVAFRNLMVDILKYGEAAQNYVAYKTEDYVTSGLTEEQKALGSAFEVPTSHQAYTNKDNGITVVGARLVYNNANKIQVAFRLNEGVNIEDVNVVLFRNGEYVSVVNDFELLSDGVTYIVSTDDILATEFDDKFTITICSGDNVTAMNNADVVVYSVQTYVANKYNDAKDGALVKAAWCYHLSAIAYQNAQ